MIFVVSTLAYFYGWFIQRYKCKYKQLTLSLVFRAAIQIRSRSCDCLLFKKWPQQNFFDSVEWSTNYFENYSKLLAKAINMSLSLHSLSQCKLLFIKLQAGHFDIYLKKKNLCVQTTFIHQKEKVTELCFETPSQFRELDVIFSYQKTPLKDCVDFPRRKKRASIYKNKSQYFCHLSILSVSR